MVTIIAGPCQHESLEQSMEIAKHCKDICDKYDIEYIFKASFDKANRTSLNGERGLGLVPTAHSFVDIKQEIHGLKNFTSTYEEMVDGKINPNEGIIVNLTNQKEK